MPSGVQIGGAFFSLEADNTQLVAAFVQAQAKADQASQAIRAAVAAQTAAIQAGTQAAAQASAAQVQAAQGAIQAAQQASQRFQQMQQAAQQAGSGFANLVKSGVALGVGLSGVQLGIATVREALSAAYDATVKLSNAEFALTAAYGAGAEEMAKYADAQSRSTEFSKASIEQGAAIISALQKEAGFTNAQQEQLLTRAGDLAAAYGKDIPQALSALENALKGRSGALSQFGALINEEVIKEYGGLSEAEKKNYAQLPEATRLRAGYNAIMVLTANSAGSAAEHLNTLGGSTANLEKATSALGAAIGKSVEPGLVTLENDLARGIQDFADFFAKIDKMTADYEAAARQRGATGFIAPFEPGAITDLNGDVSRRLGARDIPSSDTGTAFGPAFGPNQRNAITDAQNADIRAQAEERAHQAQIAAIRREARADEAKAGIEAAQQEHDRDVKALDAQKVVLEVEKDAKLKAVEANKEAALAGIEAEAKASKEASDAQIAHLHVLETAAKQAASDEHETTVAGIEASQKAAEDATAENIHNLEIERDRSKQASEDKRDAAIKALDSEKQVRDAARLQEDRQIQDSTEAAKRAEDSRHQGVLRGLDDEAKAANKKKDSDLRALDEEAKADQKHHEDRLKHVQAEEDAAHKKHDSATRAIEDDGKAASDAHDATLRRLSDEADADKATADAAARVRDAAYEAESRQRDALHQSAVDALDAETKADQDAAEQASRAREAAHQQVLAEIDQEATAAKDAHDQTLRAIDAQKNAEDDRHRTALAAIDAEQRRQQDAVDAQIAALDALDQADQQAAQDKSLQSNVTNARFGLQKAQSSGNLSEIVKAQQDLDAALAAISHTQVERERDAARDTLKAQKDAIAEQAAAEKAAEDERTRLNQQTIQDEKDTADAVLKAQLDALDKRKDAENATYAAAVQAAKDALDKQIDDINRRKRAESDAYALAKQQAQDAYAATKQASADALQKQLDDIAARKRSEDDAYKAGQDRRAAEKQDLDDALTKSLDRISKQKRAEDDAYSNAKDKLDKRKTAVDDANKDELEKIAARKQSENDAHDNAVIKAQDQATQEKRAVQDRRDAEDLADKNRRIEIQDAFNDEERDRHARFDDEATGEIPALRRALTAAQEHFRDRKTAADAQYQSETHQIDDTYNNQETGLIPLAQKAAAATAAEFAAQTRAVNEETGKQKTAINDEYSNPGKTGLLDLIEKARADTDEKLGNQRTYWEDWKEDLAGPDGKITKVIGSFDELISKIEKAGGTVAGGNGHGDDGRHGGENLDDPSSHGGGPGPNVGSDGAPEPYAVSFPFGARYSNPFNSEIPIHRGVDLVVKGAANGGEGSPVSAFEDGTVVYNGFDPNGGNGVIIRGQDGLYHRYFHFDDTSVDVGDRVHQGQTIGRLGQTGTEGAPHLHYEVSRNVNGDPVGSLINPMPYLAHGGSAAGQVFEFDLFGRHFRFTLPFGAPAGDVGRWIAAALREAGLPSDWLEPMEQIAAAESGQRNDDGSVQVGTGSADPPHNNDARGLMQTIPDTFDRYRLHSLPDDIYNPVANAAAAGRYIKDVYGDPRQTDYFSSGHFDWRGVDGYADGHLFDEPTLTYGLKSRQFGQIGETGRAERLLGVDDTATLEAMRRIPAPTLALSGASRYSFPSEAATAAVAGRGAASASGPIEHLPLNVMLGNQVVEKVWITGYKLLARRGGLPSRFGEAP